jgi:hypothetical protein
MSILAGQEDLSVKENIRILPIMALKPIYLMTHHMLLEMISPNVDFDLNGRFNRVRFINCVDTILYLT